MREEILELAAQHRLRIELSLHGDTFVSYLKHQILFNWHVESEEWFFVVHKIGEDTMIGCPTLGANWFNTWNEGICWGKQLVNGSISAQ